MRFLHQHQILYSHKIPDVGLLKGPHRVFLFMTNTFVFDSQHKTKFHEGVTLFT